MDNIAKHKLIMEDTRSTGSVEDELNELQKNLSELMTSTNMLDKRVVECLNRKEVRRYQHWQQTNTGLNQFSMPFGNNKEAALTVDEFCEHSSSMDDDKDDNKMAKNNSESGIQEKIKIQSQNEQSETKTSSTTTEASDTYNDEEGRKERNNNRTMKCRFCLTKCKKPGVNSSDIVIEAGDSTYSEYEDEGDQPESVEEDDIHHRLVDRHHHILNESTTEYEPLRESMLFVPKSLSETDVIVHPIHNASETVTSLSETNLMVVLKHANSLPCDSSFGQDTTQTSTDDKVGPRQAETKGHKVPRAPPRAPRRSPTKRRPALSPSRRRHLLQGADLILPCAPPTSYSWDRQVDHWWSKSCDPDDGIGGSASGEPGLNVAGSLVVECAHPPVVGVVYLKPPGDHGGGSHGGDRHVVLQGKDTFFADEDDESNMSTSPTALNDNIPVGRPSTPND